MQYDVVIIGAGCGGVWLLRELARAGLRVALVKDQNPLGYFASSRGQNRLHSGAMYALVDGANQSRVAKETARGCDHLTAFAKRFDPEVLTTRDSGLYIYPIEADFNRALDNARECTNARVEPLAAKIWNSEIYDSVRRLLPWAKHCMVSPEFAFDAKRLLSIVAHQATDMGGAVIETERPLEQIIPLSRKNGWELEIQTGSSLLANRVVFSAGALNRKIVQNLLTIHEDRSLLTAFSEATNKSAITVVHRPLLDRLVSLQRLPRAAEHMSLAPIGGTLTATMGGVPFAEPADNLGDFSVPGSQGNYRAFAKAMQTWLPGISSTSAPDIHVYACQKLDNVDHPSNAYPKSEFGVRHYFWTTVPNMPGVYVYSPGKWTLASVAAIAFRKVLGIAPIRARNSQSSSVRPHPLFVARQACFNAPTHKLMFGKKNWSLKKL